MVTLSLAEQLHQVHQMIAARYPVVTRIAVAQYDAHSGLLRSLVSSDPAELGMQHYERPLLQVPSLAELARQRQTRAIKDLAQNLGRDSAHTQWLLENGYRASYTVPIFKGEDLSGFLFYDAKEPHAFTPELTDVLEVFSRLISHIFFLQLRVATDLMGTVQVAVHLARIRDSETGEHLERMSAYARLMAQALTPAWGLSDEEVEYIQRFAPLHDIGKVGIPDAVLLKPGKLTPGEWDVMRQHVSIGEGIVRQIISDLNLSDTLAAKTMTQIVATHHERGDGSGYPRGLMMADIPPAGRIVAVADVYDALTNHRTYKPAWSEQAAERVLLEEAQAGRLDADCVRTLLDARQERAHIRAQYADPSDRNTQLLKAQA